MMLNEHSELEIVRSSARSIVYDFIAPAPAPKDTFEGQMCSRGIPSVPFTFASKRAGRGIYYRGYCYSTITVPACRNPPAKPLLSQRSRHCGQASNVTGFPLCVCARARTYGLP